MQMATPTVTLDAEPAATDPGTHQRLIPLKVKTILVVLGLALFGFLCYGVGTNHAKGSHVLTGRAYVSRYQGSVEVDGRSYGFEVSANGMHWYDASGGFHEGGLPPCMQHAPRYTWIRFAYSTADGRHGDSWPVVTWVQCLAMP